MRLLKALIAALIGILVLLVAALFLLPSDRIAQLAAVQFQAATGRSLTIGGAVSPSFYPVIGVTARDIRIGNPDWAGLDPMLEAAEMDIGLSLAALLRGDFDIQRIVLQEPRLHLRRDASGRSNWVFDMGTAPADPATDTPPAAVARARAVSLAEARIEGGSLRFQDEASGTDLRIERLDAVLRLPEMDGPAEMRFEGVMNDQPFQVSARTDHATRLLSGALSALNIEASAAGARLTFAGRAALENLSLEGQLDTTIPALRPLQQMLGQPAQEIDSNVLPLGFSGQITRTGDGRIFARDAQFRAGAIRLSGAADLDPSGERPRLTGQFAGDMLDLRRPAAGAGSAGAPAAAPAGWSRAPIDASALGLIDADISLSLNGLRTDLTTLGRTRIGLSIERARAVLDLREVGLFGGQLGGEFVMNNRSGLSVGGTLRLRDIDLLPLLSELADYRRLQGQANLDLQFLGVGNSVDAIMKSLRGEARLNFTQGEIIGFDLVGMLRNFDPGFVGDQNRTVYDAVTGSFVITEGIARTDDLRLDAQRFDVTGRGAVNLGARSLDLRVVPAAVRGETTLRVPLAITGPWDAPRFALDLEALAREQLRLEQEQIEAIAREEARRLEDRTRSQVEDRLQRELGVQREEGESVQDMLLRGVEQEIGNRLRGLLGGRN
ncbi:MAG: AsmA family protein [Roseinatronobacter sp.]